MKKTDKNKLTPESGVEETKKIHTPAWSTPDIEETLEMGQGAKESPIERLSKLKVQKSELEKSLKEITESIDKDRSGYEIALILKTVKSFLSDEEYRLFAFQVSFSQLSQEEQREMYKNMSEEQKKDVDLDLDFLSEKLIQMLLTLPKDQRLLALECLGKGWFVPAACGRGMGRFKKPSGCGACVDARQTFDILELWDYLIYKWDRQYGITEEIKQEVYQRVLSEWGEDVSPSIEKISYLKTSISELDTIIDRLSKKVSAYHVLEPICDDPESLEKDMPWAFARLIQALHRKQYTVTKVKVDMDSKTMAILSDYRYYSWSWGSEYGKYLQVHRGEIMESKTFVYRDAYSASKDDRSLCFDEITDIDVHWDTVTVSLFTKQHGRKEKVTFAMPYTESETPSLSPEEQKVFLEVYETQKAELLQRHTRDHKMLGFAAFYPVPGTLSAEVPYHKAEVVDEVVDELKGEASIVLKAQIDGYPLRGRQYEWVKYTITSAWSKMVDRDCAWESELQAGKEIRIKA